MDRKRYEDNGLLDEVIVLIENHRLLELRELLEEYHTIDIVDIMQNLETNMKIVLFEVLPIDIAASIVEESEVEFLSEIFMKLDEENKKNILEQVSLGDMADILKELDDELILKSVMELLSRENANELKELLVYEEESTGGIMSNKYIEVRQTMTAKQVIEHMRQNADDADTIYYIYVIDDSDKLVGVLSLRELILARECSVIEDLMTQNIIYVYDDEDREEAVKLVSKYNLVAIPVVDRNKVIKGIITVDDIIDVMEEEATEDMYKFAGTSEQEIDTVKSTVYDQVSSSISARIPWLLLMLIMGVVSTILFSNLDFMIKKEYVLLIAFIPIVMGMGGSIATQSSALTVMSLSNRDIKSNNILKEGIVGIVTGLICSILISLLIYILDDDIKIALIISISLLINMISGAVIGSFIPILLKKVNRDPAIISAPLMSVLLDITGILVVFIVAQNIL